MLSVSEKLAVGLVLVDPETVELEVSETLREELLEMTVSVAKGVGETVEE